VRVVADTETGELYEALPDDIVGGEPYDYAEYRRAQMAARRGHSQALSAWEDAIRETARTEAEYRRTLAKAVMSVKHEHGATVAETVARGTDEVAAAREAMVAAEGLERAALERVRMWRDDRVALNNMGGWSREADPDGWRVAAGS
jgi:hypothetical protein